MLEVSSNQIYSETYKALRSIDIDWGIAKDSANLCKWLATHNQFFLGSILKTTDLYKSGNISTSVNDMLAEQIAIYPNPTKGFLVIDTDYLIEKVRIFNVHGNVVESQMKENAIDFSNVSNGIYFIEIHTDKGLIRKKFIKN